MVKQRCIICLDNTEYMRNGDYAPTRFIAQQQTAEQLIGSVIRSNPESLCSIMSMSSPNIDKSLTENRQALQASLAQIPIRGNSIDLIKSLKIAQLALKKRGEEATGEKRVIIFVGSPLTHSIEDLKQIGKMYKRYNIMVDVINFGEASANRERLEAFVNEVNSDDTSHLLDVPQGPQTLSDSVLNSNILKEEVVSSGGGDVGFGASDMDEQYQLALQLSLQEYEREQQRRQVEESGGQGSTDQTPQSTQGSRDTSNQYEDYVDDDEDEMMRQALAMSLAESMNAPQSTPAQPSQSADDAMIDEDEDDEELQAAIRMSMQENADAQKEGPSESIDDIMDDEEFLKDVVSRTVESDKKNEKKDSDKQ